MSIDNLLDRVWTFKYTCNEFACEAWKQITGEDLTQRLNDFLNGHAGFDVLEEPISPCIVFFLNGKESPTHVGVFLKINYCIYRSVVRNTFHSKLSRWVLGRRDITHEKNSHHLSRSI